jgi:hypothetical protein
MTPAQSKVMDWFCTGETGLSSKTIAYWLAFDKKFERGTNYPRDPADFDRCLRLLDRVPEMRPQLHRLKELSPTWAALVDRWDEIEACHLNEVGLGWSKAREAPKTYELIVSIRNSR